MPFNGIDKNLIILLISLTVVSILSSTLLAGKVILIRKKLNSIRSTIRRAKNTNGVQERLKYEKGKSML